MVPGSGDLILDMETEIAIWEIDYKLLLAQKERLELKVERQAVQITRLESSRRTLRESNKTLREELGWEACDRCNRLHPLYPYAIPHTLDTVELCRTCIEKEMNMTLEEING